MGHRVRLARWAAMREGRRDPVGGVFVGVASILFAGTVILGDIAMRDDLPVASMLAIRFGTAAVVLAVVQVALRRPLRPAPREGRWLVALGAVGYALESGLFFLGLARGTAAAVTLLFFTYPVWVALLSAALGAGPPGWLVGGSLVAAVAGAAIVVTSSGGLDITGAGIAFALGASVTFTFYLLGVDALVRATSPLVSAMWVSGSAALGLGSFAVVSGVGRWPVGTAEWLPVLGMGGLTAGAFILLFLGLRRIGPVRTSIIAAGEPVATSLLAVLFLDQALRPGVALGGALILAGAVAASLARGPREPEASVP